MNFDYTLIPTATLAAMMLALGMELRFQDFGRLLKAPRSALLGAAGQLIVLPAVALSLALLLPLSEATAVGLMLLAACPGGTTSNMFSSYARGDVALSISLTALSGLLAPLTVPVVVGLGFMLIIGSEAPIQVSMREMMITLVFSTAVPVLVGMGLLHRYPAVARMLRGKLLGFATGFMVLLLIGLFVNTARVQPDVWGMFGRSSVAVVLLIGSCALIAAIASHVFGLSRPQENTLILEVGIQNINLALVVAVTFLADTQYLGPTLVYIPFMFMLAGVVVYRGRNNVG
ncbi:MAG: hypothetical protein NXH95_04220 [Pseudomonadaceae bacterium]|nr:hypothetical protein [Pseudomonadaceae bacterium]